MCRELKDMHTERERLLQLHLDMQLQHELFHCVQLCFHLILMSSIYIYFFIMVIKCYLALVCALSLTSFRGFF